jgi:ABC-type spermidine/putrescine transport system permease subunit I
MSQSDLLQSESRGYALFLVLPAFMVAVFFAYPLLGLLSLSFSSPDGWFGHYLDVLSDGVFLLALRNTLFFALATAFLTALLGYPVALLVASVGPTLGGVLLLLVMVPFWTSILVRAYAWIVLLGRGGLINTGLIEIGIINTPLPLLFNATGVIIGMVHVMLPYMILPVLNSMKRLNPNVLAAADSLGASRSQVFLRVLLPLTAPGVMGGFVLVFVISLGFFITPALMGGPRNLVSAKLLHEQITQQLAWPEAAAVAMVILVLTLGTFVICARVFGLRGSMSMDAR